MNYLEYIGKELSVVTLSDALNAAGYSTFMDVAQLRVRQLYEAIRWQHERQWPDTTSGVVATGYVFHRLKSTTKGVPVVCIFMHADTENGGYIIDHLEIRSK